MSSQPLKKQKLSTASSILAGSTAGAVEIGKAFASLNGHWSSALTSGAITYPFEFAKTRSQLNRNLPDAQKLPWPPFPSKQWYTGCSTLIVGNALKAASRFVAFNGFKNLLSDDEGKISRLNTAVAGLAAGVTESTLAVTPFESIKTQLIDDKQRPQPRMRGFLHGSMVIARERGIRGFFQGWVPSTARQAANSMVRFTCYTTIRDHIAKESSGGKVGTAGTFVAGGLAGIITVYTTMPLDVIKTRMQSIEARKNYRNSLHCAASIFQNEGVFTFWSGSLARLGRLSLSGAIVFTVYEKVSELLSILEQQGAPSYNLG